MMRWHLMWLLQAALAQISSKKRKKKRMQKEAFSKWHSNVFKAVHTTKKCEQMFSLQFIIHTHQGVRWKSCSPNHCPNIFNALCQTGAVAVPPRFLPSTLALMMVCTNAHFLLLTNVSSRLSAKYVWIFKIHIFTPNPLDLKNPGLLFSLECFFKRVYLVLILSTRAILISILSGQSLFGYVVFAAYKSAESQCHTKQTPSVSCVL